MIKRKDALTGEEFQAKRITQRFANAENRIKFYNQKANHIRHQKSALDKPLHKNYLILLQLLSDKKEAIYHREFLRGKGFDIRVHTHARELDGNSHFALYEYLIIPEDQNRIKFIKYD